jgi:hypothetical protein
VEIITKLLDLKLLDVVFTTDGKEYVTPQQLTREIRDELYVHGGITTFQCWSYRVYFVSYALIIIGSFRKKCEQRLWNKQNSQRLAISGCRIIEP